MYKKKLSKLPITNIKDLNFVVDCPNTNGGFVGSTPWGTADLNFGFQTSSGNLTTVNPFMSGLVFGVTFTYGGYTGFTRNSFGDMTFTIVGTENFNVFYEGLGTVYSLRVQYFIRIRCNGVVTITAS